MNFEQLQLQVKMRQLYERYGAMDAEILIAEAFAREMARHDRLEQQRAAPCEQKCDVNPIA